MIQTIAFIGVGIMGKPMVRNLMKAGFSLHIFARHKEKVEDVIAEGAAFYPSIKECVQGCDAVITMVGFPKDVEEVYYGKNNIFDSAEPGAYLIDCTTSSPSLAVRLHEDGSKKGFHVLDVPVTGGESGAIKGILSMLVGGDKEDYKACMPIFQAVGTNINYQGKAGNGQHAKMANQILVAGALSGVCEALAYGKARGMDLQVLFDSLSTGAGGSAQFSALGPKILAGNYQPGFFIKHIIKDLKLALQEADTLGLKLDMVPEVLADFEDLAAKGHENEESQALIKHYIDMEK